MIAIQEQPQTLLSTRESHWLGEPAFTTTGRLADVTTQISTFDRVPFGTNPRLDMIVRPAAARGEIPIPTAVVSKKYALVQHTSLIDALTEAVRSADVDPKSLACSLTMSESGARMRMRVELPERFTFAPPDGHRMALTFECFNSVDRTVPLFAALGWLRFVCTNGLIVGTTHASMRRYHRLPLRTDDLQPLLIEGLAAANAERKSLAGLMGRKVSGRGLDTWVDGPVAKTWGPFAATRVHSIVTTCLDGEPSRRPKSTPPHAREIENARPVPGADGPADSAYGILQALAWVAARRKEVAEQTKWRAQIPGLMDQLLVD